MIGQNQIILNHDTVIQILQEYINRTIKDGDHQIVRGYGEWAMPQPPMPPGSFIPSGPPGICIYIEHVKSMLTGKP